MRDLLRVEPSAAEIDQVEIHPIDFRTPEIGSAEVCLADLLGTFEGLLVEVVGVEARAGSLAGDRAANPAAPG